MSIVLKLSFAVATAALLASGVLAVPAVIIAPVAATVEIGGPGFGSIADTFNQNGLLTKYTAGVTSFDAYIATTPLHSYVSSGNDFFGNLNMTTLQVTYDLGQLLTINALALWNEDTPGIGKLDLSASNNGITFTSFASGLSPTDNPLNANYKADIFTFDNTTTRYVRFNASQCPQAPSTFAACAIGEVAFRIGVPEPQSWALLLVGFGLVGSAMRRRGLLATYAGKLD